MRLLGSFLVAASVGCATLPTHVPGTERVLIGGPENSIRIEMVQAAEEGDEKPVYFIRITGTDQEYEGYVLRYTLDSSDALDHEWISKLHGRERRFLQKTAANTDTPGYLLRWRNRGAPSKLTWAPDEKLDVEALLKAYLQQKKQTDALQAFSREREEKRHLVTWNDEIERLNETCGSRVTGSILWETVDDDQILASSLSCHEPNLALLSLCRDFREARESVQALSRITCAIGADQSISLDGETLSSTMPTKPPSHAKLKNFLRDEIAWPSGRLRDRTEIEETKLCTDGNGNYVGLYAHLGWKFSRVIYRQDGSWLRGRRADSKVDTDFFYDPRHFRPEVEPKYQRLSIVVVKDDRCRLRCGEQTTELELVDYETKKKLLAGKTIEPAPVPRRPYGLARNNNGVYYFVDVGPEASDRDFRIFAGRKGAMDQLDMVDLVTDSGGDIFVTKSGKLRLVLGKDKSFWIEGKASTALINLPVEDNLLVIYNQLGVYLGQPYGTPCDVF